MSKEKIKHVTVDLKRAIDNVGVIAVLIIMLPSLNFIMSRVMFK